MKKFQNENDVVIVMSQSEKLTLDLLVAYGVIALREDRDYSDDDINSFRAFRDALDK